MKQKKISETGLEDQLVSSVYDFMYYDVTRTASLLAQCDPSGHLTQLSQVRSAREGRDSKASFDGSANIALAKVKNSTEEHLIRSHEQGVSRTYDPSWSNARQLLDILNERGLIRRDIRTAEVGQIVLLEGALAIYDLKLVSQIWNLNSVSKLLKKSFSPIPDIPPAKRNTPGGKALAKLANDAKEEAKLHAELASEILPNLPHSVQLRLKTDDEELAWASIDRGGLTTEGTDIALKHGVNIPGRWAVLGILDAPIEEDVDTGPRMQSNDGAEMLSILYESFVPIVRQFAGRPKGALGITPLLVFREVK
ncbi:hypothetical protein RPE78_09635 [Thioclava litoralis]|uniref:Uncharacterized protein n=1 Tax=Thioclava litoralis TaxID=3076557 RepID=A0ABZ1DW14_9RHOB|nr:hypothetical protein RPE78_09635 [Thioclava sp. FTW29]